MLENEKKFLDQKGVEYLWSKINMQDYPNNDTLVAIINAIDEGKMDKTTAIPLIEQAIAGQMPVVKSVDENGKPIEWEAKNFPDHIKTIYIQDNSFYPGGNANILAYDTEKILKGAEIVGLFRGSILNEIPFALRCVGHPQTRLTHVFPKTWRIQSIDGGYIVRVHYGDNYADLLFNSVDDSIIVDPDWVAPTTPSDIPDTTESHQYLTTNENGEKVWENKPDIATLQSAIDILNGTGDGSVKNTVAEAVATIIAQAPEDFDTLKEIADWIANDNTGTLNLIERVDKAEKDIIALDIQADWNQTDESAKDFILNKPVPITDDEIDAICGETLTLDITENALVDITTGIVYRIYVEDGKLSMKQVNESTSAEQLIFVDISTDIVYKVYVENGKLHMMEVE